MVALSPIRLVKDAFVAKKLVDVALVVVEFPETEPETDTSPLTVREPVIVVVATSSMLPVIDPPVKDESVIAPFVNVEVLILLSTMELSLMSPRNVRSSATSSIRL